MVENDDYSIPETATRTKRGKNKVKTHNVLVKLVKILFSQLFHSIKVDLLL